uniref:Uncharacterized protein n=1 Tax=Timema shepardi TaxID=629360 RepID=A0A7R9FXT9_TIMSH|nr:unnamed protein product [Timema shepardi]
MISLRARGSVTSQNELSFRPAVQHWRKDRTKNCWALQDDGHWAELSCKNRTLYTISDLYLRELFYTSESYPIPPVRAVLNLRELSYTSESCPIPPGFRIREHVVGEHAEGTDDGSNPGQGAPPQRTGDRTREPWGIPSLERSQTPLHRKSIHPLSPLATVAESTLSYTDPHPHLPLVMSLERERERSQSHAREDPEPVFDLSDCALKSVPAGIYSLCKVFRKDALYLQENQLRSLAGGGNLQDLSLLQVLDIHSNSFIFLPDDITLLRSLRILNVSSNNLKSLPEALSSLQKLRVLNVSFNNLRAIPSSVGKLCYLHTLDLRGNKSLNTLPNNLCQATGLRELMVDPTGFIHPPTSVVQMGTVEVIKFLCSELGVGYVSPCESPEEGAFASNSSCKVNSPDADDKDKFFQEQRQLERIALEKELEEQHRRELELQHGARANKNRVGTECNTDTHTSELLEDLAVQQSHLESEIMRVQMDRETDRLHLIKQIQQVELTADAVISQLLALSEVSRDSSQLQHLLEQELKEEDRLLNMRQEEYQSLRRKEVLNGMEALLEEECRREAKLREYEEGRAEATRTLLSQEVETDKQLSTLLLSQGQAQSELVGRLQKDEELQRAAVAALLERGDARSWALVHQVAVVESQLASLTALEMERKKLEMNEQIFDLSEKRVALSAMLVDLLSQQADRRRQLLNTLDEMERRRWISDQEKGEKSDEDFWLLQYQRLLDSRPYSLVEMERSLDPMLAQHLVVHGAIHCLPFLAQWAYSTQDLHQLNDHKLREASYISCWSKDMKLLNDT